MKFSKIYTKKGDLGMTSIPSGKVSKGDSIIYLLGKLDKLHLLTVQQPDSPFDSNDWFAIMGDIANIIPDSYILKAAYTTLELKIKEVSDKLEEKHPDGMKHWLPYDSIKGLSREYASISIEVREVELQAWNAIFDWELDERIGSVLNAMSKYYFLLAVLNNH